VSRRRKVDAAEAVNVAKVGNSDLVTGVGKAVLECSSRFERRAAMVAVWGEVLTGSVEADVIARRTRLGKRRVQRALRELIERGVVGRSESRGGAIGGSWVTYFATRCSCAIQAVRRGRQCAVAIVRKGAHPVRRGEAAAGAEGPPGRVLVRDRDRPGRDRP
jgi:hypothetical protein